MSRRWRWSGRWSAPARTTSFPCRSTSRTWRRRSRPSARSVAEQEQPPAAGNAKVVSVIKSVGGVGATALLTQLGIRFAEHEAAIGREACLIDLDVQFGDAAFQLGLQPKLSLADLLEAGARLDGDLLRATTTEHPSGLKVIAAPPDMMPLEALSSDQLLEIVDLATREFGTVFVDLPTNWTNWSLSLLARSDLVLLVTELSVAEPAPRPAPAGPADVARTWAASTCGSCVNRLERACCGRSVRPTCARRWAATIAYTIANDHRAMRAAIDRGVPIAEIKRKSALGKDIDALDAGIAAALGLER